MEHTPSSFQGKVSFLVVITIAIISGNIHIALLEKSFDNISLKSVKFVGENCWYCGFSVCERKTLIKVFPWKKL